MNNLVKQQGCAGSGVTSFTPTGRLFSYQREAGQETRICHRWKGDLTLPTCVPQSVSLVLLSLEPQNSLFYCCSIISQHCIFPVNGHHDRGGCRALCPGKAVLHAASVTSYLSWMQDIRKEKKKQNLFCRREWQDKQITRKWETASFHDILRSATAMSSHQLRHPRDASTWFLKGSCMHHSGTVISHSSGGSLHPHTTKKKKTKTTHQSGSFPSEQMTKLFCSFFFFLFFSSEQEFVAEWKPIAHLFPETQFSPKWTLSSTNEALFEELQSTAASPAETGILDSMLREPLMHLKGLLWDHHWQLRSKVGLPHPDEADSRCF